MVMAASCGTGAERARYLRAMTTADSAAADTQGEDFDAQVWQASLLFRSWLASRYLDDGTAKRLLDAVGSANSGADFPELYKMRGLVDAQRALAAKRFDDALAAVSAAWDGTELYAAHLVRMEALAGKGDVSGAREEARWLATHRGRAYTQACAQSIFMAFDIAQSNLAQLYQAEFSVALEDSKDARKNLDSFQRIWSEKDLPDWIGQRTADVERKLEALESKATKGR
jgi:hypothetical protein